MSAARGPAVAADRTTRGVFHLFKRSGAQRSSRHGQFRDPDGADALLADRIEGVAGEFSPFEELHGFSIDGVDLETSALPEGWRDRLVKVQNANTAGLAGGLQFTGWCLDKEDLCVAKLCALREKDQNFVSELLRADLVDRGVIAARLAPVPERYRPNAERAATWLASSA